MWTTHGMNPMNVLRMAASMGAPLKGILLVGCEPATLGPDEGQMGLSEPVEKAVEEAVELLDVSDQQNPGRQLASHER